MEIKSAIFKCSSQFLDQCPNGVLPEFGFIGRSNVGKSSLVNMITGNKSLAKVSGTPGKTRLINHFLIDDMWYLVDLPGYGYAKVSKVARKEFSSLITSYVTESKNLVFLFVLVDSRHEPQKIDVDFITFLGINHIPFGIVFTKCDKLSDNQTQSNVASYKRFLKKQWAELPPMFVTSAENKIGKESILDYIGVALKLVK